MADWTHGALLSVDACPACGSARRAESPLRIADHLGTGAADLWTMWRCADCASLFLDPRPDDRSIPATYARYYTHAQPVPATATGGAARLLWPMFRGYLGRRFGWDEPPSVAAGGWLCACIPPLRFKLDYLGRHLFSRDFPAKGRLLDIGSGNGEFLDAARRMGWTASGIEPDAHAVKACEARGLDVFAGTLSDYPPPDGGRFDAITSSNCIEHVPDPAAFLAKAFDLLVPGGRIWIATPNPEGPGVRVFGRCWRGLEPSRHLCVPSQRQLHSLLRAAGFVGIRFHRRGAHGKTITRESAQVARIEARLGQPVPRGSRWLAAPVRLWASLLGTLSPRFGEETVVTARRPCARPEDTAKPATRP